MNLAAGRRVSVIALAVGMALLTGCTSPSSALPASSKTPTKSKPTPSATPRPSPTPTLDLSFEGAEDVVTATGSMEWIERMFVEEQFSVTSADDGAGSFSYLDESTDCEIAFYQGQIFDLDKTQDDRTMSDWMIANIAFQATPTAENLALIKANGVDDTIPLVNDGGQVAVRVIEGQTQDGGTLVLASRMIGIQGGGLTISVLCPDGSDASEEYFTLVDSFLTVNVKP
jgi:hypothetical protein